MEPTTIAFIVSFLLHLYHAKTSHSQGSKLEKKIIGNLTDSNSHKKSSSSKKGKKYKHNSNKDSDESD